ncbi:hypothetical protein P7C73_g2929, partial [Tremellales sp. Uapishka_1]
MPLLRSSTRPVVVECFFCLSPSLLPPQPAESSPNRKGKNKIAPVGTRWNFQCERCGCWNIRDETLIMNLLANYLPDDDDPTFPSLHQNLPSYLTSLHSRYPPVCEACRPSVDEALRKADHKAQVEAWGSALNRGMVKSSELNAPAAWKDRVEEVVWTLRGIGFATSLVVSTTQGGLAMMATPRLEWYHPASWWLIGFHLLSILWIAWDPFWLKRKRARDKAKGQGRGTWVRNMLLVLVARVVSSLILRFRWGTDGMVNLLRGGFVVEVALFIHALTSLRISRPISLKLVRPVQITSATPHSPSIPQCPPPSADFFSSLSLSSNPAAPSNPVFGHPSLQSHQSVDTSMEMDWEPTPSSRPKAPDISWDSFAVNKQRMYPSQQQEDTGLEMLLAGWGIGGEVDPSRNHVSNGLPDPYPNPNQMVVVWDLKIARRLLGSLAIVRLGVLVPFGGLQWVDNERFKAASSILDAVRKMDIGMLGIEICITLAELVMTPRRDQSLGSAAGMVGKILSIPLRGIASYRLSGLEAHVEWQRMGGWLVNGVLDVWGWIR